MTNIIKIWKDFFTVEQDNVRYVVGNDGVVRKYVPKLGSSDANYKVKILTISKSKKMNIMLKSMMVANIK